MRIIIIIMNAYVKVKFSLSHFTSASQNIEKKVKKKQSISTLMKTEKPNNEISPHTEFYVIHNSNCHNCFQRTLLL